MDSLTNSIYDPKDLLPAFIKQYSGDESKIKIYSSPARINIIGEHIDYNGGFVFPAAINRYLYVAIRKRNDSKIIYNDIRFPGNYEFDINDNFVYNKENGYANYLNGILSQLKAKGCNFDVGFEILMVSNVPAAGGISSSSALECGFAYAVSETYGFNIDRIEIAKLGQMSEHNFMNVNWLKKVWYKINPKYKDRLFCIIFGREKYKRYALELYNAINKSHYTDLSDLEIITLEDAVYIKMKNDVAYLVSDYIAVYEHQGTINNNMPIRGFMYFGELYSKILKSEKKRLYNRKLIKIPTPQYVVFYNGTEEYPEISKLKLSDAFSHPVIDGEYEFTATVYNINYGKNKNLLDSCSSLKGYSIFVDRVRKNEIKMSIENAVDKAVQDCIKDNILRDVLSEERSAAMLEMLTTFDEKLYEEGLKEEFKELGLAEGKAEGRAEGLAEGRAEGLVQGNLEGDKRAIRSMYDLGLSEAQICQKYDASLVRDVLKNYADKS